MVSFYKYSIKVAYFFKITDYKIKMLISAGRELGTNFTPQLCSAFRPIFNILPDQTNESFHEKTNALNICLSKIDELFLEHTQFVKGPLLCGPPGAGKRYILYNLFSHSIARNLRVMTTAYTSERAQALGGVHFHSLFSVPVIEKQVTFGFGELLEAALANLYRNIDKFCFDKQTTIML